MPERLFVTDTRSCWLGRYQTDIWYLYRCIFASGSPSSVLDNVFKVTCDLLNRHFFKCSSRQTFHRKRQNGNNIYSEFDLFCHPLCAIIKCLLTLPNSSSTGSPYWDKHTRVYVCVLGCGWSDQPHPLKMHVLHINIVQTVFFLWHHLPLYQQVGRLCSTRPPSLSGQLAHITPWLNEWLLRFPCCMPYVFSRARHPPTEQEVWNSWVLLSKVSIMSPKMI